ncbi:NahK/ErcS family hybrid sensor histidine kinase/response regulator [Novosphingobium sp. SG707]|uniref:hybrid sensor histidine kinase/response regulator n=1 Tax=Novosphingobium sp. SG707 TaxID=2586996 RepID=UPI0014475DDA|nr:NahK/ErcS family hybrid sensor histidine kinase/response regulator [Novosphingobium sp. SG707]NKJ01053.1 signal transduction histidine kinase/CheY-like chemotaxis protein [Novosphingobium sp. SG707]
MAEADRPDAGALVERIRQLEKINEALIDRVERSSDVQGGAFSMFEAAIALEAMVRDRTAALEQALSRLNEANAEMAEAHRDADAARVRLRDAIESLPDGFALFDADDRLLLHNEAYLGFWPALRGRDLSSVTFGEIAEMAAQCGLPVGSLVSRERWLADRLSQHAKADRVHIQALADGRWVQINELKTSEGGRVGIYTDVTEVKAEDARERARELAERNLVLQATLDTLSEGVCHYGLDRRLLVRNQGMVRLLGLDARGSKRLETHAGLLSYCRDRLGMDSTSVLEWRETGEQMEGPCILGGRHFIIRSTPLTPGGGMAFSFDDITERVQDRNALREAAEMLERRVAERTTALQAEIAERREVEGQLRAAKTAAEHANRDKTRFLAAASHDLLQPLNAARLFVSALAERRLAAPSRALVRQTGVALDSVEDLLEALFEISRLDAGAITPAWSAIELEPMLAALRIEFAAVARAEGLSLDIPVTDVWVRSDIRLLRRILQNFLSNAIRYTAQGCVSIKITAEDGGVRITVRDTGPGIAPEHQEAIFEEFRRLESTQRIPGKGLGLAIVRRASTMLGHRLDVESTPGEGSAFSVLVPLAEARSDKGGDASRPVRPGVTGTQSLLVIDNDPAILAGMAALLRNWGHHVATATGPLDEEAAEAIAQGIDMIIADYHLDDALRGDEAIAILRKAAGREVPALVITADRSDEVKATLAQARVPMLNKPVKPAQLRALMRNMLGNGA